MSQHGATRTRVGLKTMSQMCQSASSGADHAPLLIRDFVPASKKQEQSLTRRSQTARFCKIIRVTPLSRRLVGRREASAEGDRRLLPGWLVFQPDSLVASLVENANGSCHLSCWVCSYEPRFLNPAHPARGKQKNSLRILGPLESSPSSCRPLNDQDRPRPTAAHSPYKSSTTQVWCRYHACRCRPLDLESAGVVSKHERRDRQIQTVVQPFQGFCGSRAKHERQV